MRPSSKNTSSPSSIERSTTRPSSRLKTSAFLRLYSTVQKCLGRSTTRPSSRVTSSPAFSFPCQEKSRAPPARPPGLRPRQPSAFLRSYSTCQEKSRAPPARPPGLPPRQPSAFLRSYSTVKKNLQYRKAPSDQLSPAFSFTDGVSKGRIMQGKI
jgi:hypothetical protein